MMDPAALLIMFLFSMITGFLGIFELIRTASSSSGGGGNVAVSFILNSPISGSPFLVIATLWAFYNAVAPYRKSPGSMVPHWWPMHTVIISRLP